MKPVSGKRMCKILEAKGWRLARVTGSHHIFVIPGRNTRISVPVHGNRDLKAGLQEAVMKLADIRDEDL
jgi:predicted RNA binding protein YcfA (HicA-like mRNA interferase family)